MNLMTNMLKNAIHDLLEAKGIRASVEDKVNRYGRIVIGVILDEHQPDFGKVDGAARRGSDQSSG